jgi:hypothetical protein
MSKARILRRGDLEAARSVWAVRSERYAGLPLEWARLWIERDGDAW